MNNSIWMCSVLFIIITGYLCKLSNPVIISNNEKLDVLQKNIRNHINREFRQQCHFTRDCRALAYNCVDGLCECALGYRPDSTNETCVGGIGKRCMYDSHCIMRAYCKGQLVCTCKEEFPYESEDGWRCEDEPSSQQSHHLPKESLLLLLSQVLVGLLTTWHHLSLI
ncbi:uncharacterized protein LOC129798328 [Phlebotomus papatasi]|uniref:uncharacterized protein LOC129798328 n=1 Tax=Phlebotomus papatasi TaxID=29031 RepID=UPI0024841FC0|nr:uncharacterized protein LOC129798328 [Phlebotomus papatasi]XP_055697411.1 uncharacterized protein LOC129798328 [Phlebotomus papatasi]